jgi:hypothetical protein
LHNSYPSIRHFVYKFKDQTAEILCIYRKAVLE